jgi:hypothetical protein
MAHQYDLFSARGHVAGRMDEEARRTTRRPARPKRHQPFRFDVKRENDGARPARIVDIGMWLPAVHQDGGLVGERIACRRRRTGCPLPRPSRARDNADGRGAPSDQSISRSATRPKAPCAIRNAVDIANSPNSDARFTRRAINRWQSCGRRPSISFPHCPPGLCQLSFLAVAVRRLLRPQ